jgi:5-carboxymethyl-2-hydroxymuconate isomerase
MSMPHLVIEYSAEGHDGRFDAPALMRALHDAAASTGVMKAEDIKIRAMPYSDYLVARRQDGFCHVNVYLLAGRSSEQKIWLSEALRAAMSEILTHTQSLSVDIRDMDPDCYKKRLLS